MLPHQPAGVQYVGMSGITQPCIDAVARLLTYDDHVVSAMILTCNGGHSLLLGLGHPPSPGVESEVFETVLVKDGFSHGYPGEGPKGFSYVLQLLTAHDVDISEVEVSPEFFKRANSCMLTISDLDELERLEHVRPVRWHRYLLDRHEREAKENLLWKAFRPAMPFALIDPRIMDLALSFWEDPDQKLVKTYRRLESIIRERTGLERHGAKLFAEAFQSKPPKLSWSGIPAEEQVARANLFSAIFGTYRNPRGHRELEQHAAELLGEFLVANELYRLESQAKPSAATPV